MKELMRDRLKVYPFQSDGADRLFLARFEFPQFEEDFQIPKGDWRSLKLLPGEEAPPATEDDKPIGFIHYLAGFPIDCVEMLMLIGEYSSDENSITVVPGKGRPTAPVPNFFIWPDEEKLLLNTTALVEQYSLFLAENLPGEPEPAKAHWWFRVELVGPQKFPIPGEFLALGIRMMPGEFWGRQKSSPFIYSGNWMDTVYYSGAVVTEVIEPTAEKPYPTYKVQWRKDKVTAKPTDFTEYKVGDRVTILKDVTSDKKTEIWKDEDTDRFPEDDRADWRIVPVSFYGLDDPK